MAAAACVLGAGGAGGEGRRRYGGIGCPAMWPEVLGTGAVRESRCVCAHVCVCVSGGGEVLPRVQLATHQHITCCICGTPASRPYVARSPARLVNAQRLPASCWLLLPPAPLPPPLPPRSTLQAAQGVWLPPAPEASGASQRGTHMPVRGSVGRKREPATLSLSLSHASGWPSRAFPRPPTRAARPVPAVVQPFAHCAHTYNEHHQRARTHIRR